MDKKLTFDYYYGIEAEQFSFYRVPRLLIKDARFWDLSSDAKLLYGLMLDRMALSMKNGWLDEENRAYIIYAVENVMEDLGCSKPTCIKIIKELDVENGIGLIERKRRGLGKPDIIYVKNFATLQTEDEPEKSEWESVEVENAQKRDVLEEEKTFTSASKETELLEVKNFDPNYNNNSYTNQNNTEESNIYPIYPSGNQREDRTDTIDEINAYIELIKENIAYEHHMKFEKYGDKELYDELFQVICDVVCVERRTVRIGREDYPYALVKAKFLKLNESHLGYVMECMKNTTTKINNIKAYMLTALYNAPNTMGHYYQQEVQHDMYGVGWEKKDTV